MPTMLKMEMQIAEFLSAAQKGGGFSRTANKVLRLFDFHEPVEKMHELEVTFYREYMKIYFSTSGSQGGVYQTKPCSSENIALAFGYIAGVQSERRSTERQEWKMHSFWDLVARALPPGCRRNGFDPAYEDHKREHLMDYHSRFPGTWSRRWLNLCFHWNAALMVLEAAQAWVAMKLFMWVQSVLSWFI